MKPENILMTSLDDDAIPLITDFGLSVLLRPNETVKERIGTLPYCSPQILKGDPYSKLADIWALGVILYEMVCKVRPFVC